MKYSVFLDTVMPFKDKVFRLAKRLLVSTQEAEDATQELYGKLWKNRAALHQYRNLEAYAMTVTKNYCLDRLKSKQAGHLSLVHSNYQAKEKDLEEQISLRNSVEIVHRLIDQLAPQQKMVIQLRDIEHYNFEEIAQILGVSQPAVRVALSRARKKIREQLLNTHRYGLR